MRLWLGVQLMREERPLVYWPFVGLFKPDLRDMRKSKTSPLPEYLIVVGILDCDCVNHISTINLTVQNIMMKLACRKVRYLLQCKLTLASHVTGFLFVLNAE